MKKIILLCLIFSFCSVNSKKKDNKDLASLFFWYLQTLSNHELYKYIEDPAQKSTSSTSQFVISTAAPKSNKTKVILIHGWDYSERSSVPATSFEKKVQQITSTWSSAFEYYNKDIGASRTNFDFYAFTYRTSDSISLNGTRFAEKLNSTFTSTDKIIVVASSMGGLVTRYAMYDAKNTGDVIDYVVTLGTPHYGSPFASSAYQVSSTVLAEAISFMTSTDGGRGLSHTNNGSGQTSITNATNTELDTLNSYSTKDSRFYPYVGDLSSDCNSAKSGTVLVTGCTLLKTGSPVFSTTDGIVPINSAKMANKVSSTQITTKAGFDHLMLTFKITADPTLGETFFTEVITKLKTFTF